MDQASNKRIQLTLFVDDEYSETIESIRYRYNPLQHMLIKSHVTLCREDELLQLALIKNNLSQLKVAPLDIAFERPIRFADGKGVLLPAIGISLMFQELRALVLKGAVEHPRIQKAHITLMHPRNSACTDVLFKEIEKAVFPRTISFKKISLIVQENDGPWQILETYNFGNN